MKGNSTHSLKGIFLTISCILLTTGCDLFGDDNRSDISGPASCSAEDYNQYIYDTMKNYYYWYEQADPFNQIDPTDISAYPTPQSLIEILKYSTLDRLAV